MISLWSVWHHQNKMVNGCTVSTEGFINCRLKQRTGWVFNLAGWEFQNSPLFKQEKSAFGVNRNNETTSSTIEIESETKSEYKESVNSDEQSTRTSKKYSNTTTLAKLTTSTKLSTRKEATFCQQLSQKGGRHWDISQFGNYKATPKEAVKLI